VLLSDSAFQNKKLLNRFMIFCQSWLLPRQHLCSRGAPTVWVTQSEVCYQLHMQIEAFNSYFESPTDIARSYSRKGRWGEHICW